MYGYIIVDEEKLRQLVDRLYVSPTHENLRAIRKMFTYSNKAFEAIEAAYLAGNAQSHFKEDWEEMLEEYLKNVKEKYDKGN